MDQTKFKKMKDIQPFKRINIFFIIFVLGLVSPSMTWAKLNIVTTTEDIASIVKEVGGDLVKVKTIIKGYQDPHYIQAKPSFMLQVNRADLLIYQGLELEIGWLPILIQGGRNKKVLPGRLGLLDLSQSITPLNIPMRGVDRSVGDIHPLGNPHYHLDPQNGFLMANYISRRLTQLDPSNADAFKANLENFSKRLENKIKAWKARMEKFLNFKVITYHATWNYLLDFLYLESVGTIENRPGIPPTGKHLSELAAAMKQTHTRVILQSNFFENEFSELLASKTNGEVLVLPASVGGSKDAQSYIALFDVLINKLESTFEKHLSHVTKERP
jgi:zinc/manganese transport system substrate-binding protein